jgi:pimeloyl-ACP methyl ester carboxylesterase
MDRIEEFFVRPQRQKYFQHDLGPSLYFSRELRVRRTDFTVRNLQDKQIHVSLFESDFDKNTSNCVVYLHTHHGSRLEGLPLVNKVLHGGANFCLFDFAGYGNSDGTTVTLGYLEKHDISCVLAELRQRNQKNFVLWGRSMGAVAALLYNQHSQDKSVVASVYDSPFCSLEKLTLELGSRNSGIPQFFLKPAISILKSSLKDQLDFSELELL